MSIHSLNVQRLNKTKHHESSKFKYKHKLFFKVLSIKLLDCVHTIKPHQDNENPYQEYYDFVQLFIENYPFYLVSRQKLISLLMLGFDYSPPQLNDSSIADNHSHKKLKSPYLTSETYYRADGNQILENHITELLKQTFITQCAELLAKHKLDSDYGHFFFMHGDYQNTIQHFLNTYSTEFQQPLELKKMQPQLFSKENGFHEIMIQYLNDINQHMNHLFVNGTKMRSIEMTNAKFEYQRNLFYYVPITIPHYKDFYSTIIFFPFLSTTIKSHFQSINEHTGATSSPKELLTIALTLSCPKSYKIDSSINNKHINEQIKIHIRTIALQLNQLCTPMTASSSFIISSLYSVSQFNNIPEPLFETLLEVIISKLDSVQTANQPIFFAINDVLHLIRLLVEFNYNNSVVDLKNVLTQITQFPVYLSDTGSSSMLTLLQTGMKDLPAEGIIAYSEQSYFETHMQMMAFDNIPLSSEDYLPLLKNEQKIHSLVFDLVQNNVTMTQNKFNAIQKLLFLHENELISSQFLIIIDATLCSLSSQELKDLISKFREIEKDLELSLAILVTRSCIKLDTFGVSIGNLGLAYGYFDESKFKNIATLFNTDQKDLELTHHITWFNHLYLHNQLQNQFVEQLYDNGTYILQKIQAYLGIETLNSQNNDLMINEPRATVSSKLTSAYRPFILSLETQSISTEKFSFIFSFNIQLFFDLFPTIDITSQEKDTFQSNFCSKLNRLISELASIKNVPIFEQDSFGYSWTNIGECHTAIRVSIGADSDYNDEISDFIIILLLSTSKIKESFETFRITPGTTMQNLIDYSLNQIPNLIEKEFREIDSQTQF